MLSDDQKKIIEAEERHRHAFRKTLEEASAAISKTVDSAVSEVKEEKAKLGSKLLFSQQFGRDTAPLFCCHHWRRRINSANSAQSRNTSKKS